MEDGVWGAGRRTQDWVLCKTGLYSESALKKFSVPDSCGVSAGQRFKNLQPDETALKGEELGKEGYLGWVAGVTTCKTSFGRKSSQVVSGLGTPLPSSQGLKWLFLTLRTVGPARTPSENRER